MYVHVGLLISEEMPRNVITPGAHESYMHVATVRKKMY